MLIGLLYGTFGMGFGIRMGIHQRRIKLNLHHINLIGFYPR